MESKANVPSVGSSSERSMFLSDDYALETFNWQFSFHISSRPIFLHFVKNIMVAWEVRMEKKKFYKVFAKYSPILDSWQLIFR